MEGEYVADLRFGKHRFDSVRVGKSALQTLYGHSGDKRACGYDVGSVGTRYASVRGNFRNVIIIFVLRRGKRTDLREIAFHGAFAYLGDTYAETDLAFDISEPVIFGISRR